MSPTLRRRAALVMGGLLVGVALAEGLARVLDPSGGAELLFNAPDAYPRGLYVADPELRVVPRPRFVGRVRALSYEVPVRINRSGLRGPEVSGPGWLVLGDSFTLALQVPEEQSFVALVAEASGRSLLNAGVDGYGTWQANGRYRRLADELQVQGVLLVFFLGNDLNDNRWLRRLPPGGRSPGVHEPPPMPPVTGWLFRNSALYAHWRVASRRAQVASQGMPQWRDELGAFHRDGSLDLEPTRQALSELKRWTAERGHPVRVAVAPPAFQVHSERAEGTFAMVGFDVDGLALGRPGEELLRLLDELGIEACDLQAPLVAASSEPLYFQYDGHWNPRGHRVVAQALADCMGDD